jgi:hypothetical protein
MVGHDVSWLVGCASGGLAGMRREQSEVIGSSSWALKVWAAQRRAWGLVLRVGMCGSDERDKSVRWMPWRQEAMKDVARCDKLRGDASDR